MILLTGASGFLGQAIVQELGSKIEDTIGRKNCTINIDLSMQVPRISKRYDTVIHAAGKAHSIPKSLLEEEQFFAVNKKGTSNLLSGLEQLEMFPKHLIFISSVAVYGKDYGVNISEESPLTATDAYGKSKIEAEIIVAEWCKVNNVTCTILRLPLLAGANPPGNLKSMINGINKGYYFNIGGGVAKKSIVLTTDIAKILPRVGAIGGIYNLTDGYNPTFYELSKCIAMQLGKPNPKNLPRIIASSISLIGDLIGEKFPINSKKLKKITSDLTFDDSKARALLDWSPQAVLSKFKIK
jgi:nucleoside-diphosphate-sugar epimerase